MTYQYITQYDSPNYSKGRPFGRPTAIYIHHWGTDGQRFTNVVNYLCRKNGNSSAHYVVEAGRVACIVDPDDRAWHAGALGNARGIGIECRPEMSQGDLETVAELIAALRNAYGNLPLKPHSAVMPTACPGRWKSKLAWLSERANQINAGTPAPTPRKTVKAATKTGAQLTVDGWAGRATISRLQQLLGTPQDGYLSGQTAYNRTRCPHFTSMLLGKGGSTCIRALQRRLGATADGYIGEQTVRAWQQRLGVTVDGYAGNQTVTAIQQALNEGTIF